jgi:hypothetical protein
MHTRSSIEIRRWLGPAGLGHVAGPRAGLQVGPAPEFGLNYQVEETAALA